MMAIALTSYTQGKNILVYGSNECSDGNDTEGVAVTIVE
jgi:hypothetical protein